VEGTLEDFVTIVADSDLTIIFVSGLADSVVDVVVVDVSAVDNVVAVVGCVVVDDLKS